MKKHSIMRWIILCFTGIFALSLAISAVANYQENYRYIMLQAERDIDRCIELTNVVLQEGNFKDTIISGNSELYKDTRESLRFLCAMFGLDNMIIYRLDPETRLRYVYFYISPDEEINRMYEERYPLHTVLDDPLMPAEEQWIAGERDIRETASNGQLMIWIISAQDPESGLEYMIALETNPSIQDKAVLQSFLWDIFPIGLALVLGLVILLILVRRRVILPIGTISDSMKRFASDRSSMPEPILLKNTKDEIGEIAASYAKMTADIRTYISNIENLTNEKLETKIQLDVCRRIQYGLVPEKKNLNGSGFRVSAMTQPAKEVSGDFYDCFLRDGNHVCIVMGDVSGKGISAAVFMAMAKTMIREKLLAGLNPAKALNQVNAELYSQNPEGLFVTVFAAVLNPHTGEMTYANAGHTNPVLLGDQSALLNPPPGIVLGLFTDADLKDSSLTLAPSEGILLYTDGVTEAANPQNQFFGEQRLLKTLETIPAGADPEFILSGVSQAVSAFDDGREPFDDMALLALFRIPAGEGCQEIQVAASSFENIKKAAFAAAGNTPKVRKALLACDEALANIVSYSGATELSFSCEKRGNILCVVFSDNGIPFDPTAVQPEEKEFEALDTGGMGLNIIRQTASAMQYKRLQDRNELIMFFRL